MKLLETYINSGIPSPIGPKVDLDEAVATSDGGSKASLQRRATIDEKTLDWEKIQYSKTALKRF